MSSQQPIDPDADGFSFVDAEHHILEFWQSQDIFQKSLQATQDNDPYIFYDGPPFATGLPHHGHLVGSILKEIRRGDVLTLHSLRHGAAEAIEIIAHGDKKTSNVIGKTLGELKLPPAANIGAIFRKKKVIIPDKNTEIMALDKLIIFVPKKDQISKD